MRPERPVPFEYATSHPIEEVAAPGVVLLRKDLRPGALLPEARGRKPAFVTDPRREPAVYRELLGPASVGPRLHDTGEDWVLVERVPGVELWQVGDLAVWEGVAAWLPAMHERLAATRAGAAAGALPLLEHDRSFYERWLARAAPRLGAARPAVTAAHRLAVQRLLTLPRGVIHGELYPSNVLVAGRGESLQVWPVDWEMAGTGPLLMDLAALASGWGAAERQRLAAGYARAAPGIEPAEVSTGLDACSLHLSLQWLGWSDGWQPPTEHRQDWLALAVDCARWLTDAIAGDEGWT